MAEILYDGIELCQCCTMKLANDDVSGCDFHECHNDVGGEPLGKIDREFAGLDWSKATLVIDKSGDEIGFRIRPCVGCGQNSDIASEAVILV